MSAEKKKKPKYHYYILLDGKYVGDSWAVSEAKAINMSRKAMSFMPEITNRQILKP